MMKIAFYILFDSSKGTPDGCLRNIRKNTDANHETTTRVPEASKIAIYQTFSRACMSLMDTIHAL